MNFTLIQGDITTQEVDAIVNAANSSLLGGGGVDGAIHRKGGAEILADCRKIRARQGGLPTGEAVITTAGKLPARHVIHTVGPVWLEGSADEFSMLSSCYRESLMLARERGIRTIAFPNISTGIYAFPKEPAARIAMQTCKHVSAQHLGDFDEIRFVCFDPENFSIYQSLWLF